MTGPIVRVLIVDDYESWRNFYSKELRKRTDLQIIAQASDGLDAIHQAEELQPNLILLDIGLPTLNGINAARRMREVSPASKILFVTQEGSAGIVEEALNTGAFGYVAKWDAVSDLLPAVEAVLAGNRFLSAGLCSNGCATSRVGSVSE